MVKKKKYSKGRHFVLLHDDGRRLLEEEEERLKLKLEKESKKKQRNIYTRTYTTEHEGGKKGKK